MRAADLRGSDQLDLTQEYIAEMLGVRRTSVSVVAHMLQQAGMIRYTRGHIKLTDVEALRDTACECYEAVKMGARVQHLERGEDSLAHNIEQATRCLKPLGRPSVGSKQPLGGEPSSAKDHWPQCD